MISLDFKLTSGQVKALLHLYHGEPLNRCGGYSVVDLYPALHFVQTASMTAQSSLFTKGLARVVKVDPELPRTWTYELTEQGRALAQVVVQQSQNVVALEESRKQLERDNAHARAEIAAGVDMNHRPHNPKPKLTVRPWDGDDAQKAKPRIRIHPDGTTEFVASAEVTP